ncbi:hypothetical protein ACFY2M_39205 [Streptomyces sp. NPDC001276]|uniref:hypothetical protein n=1 Tax=Streptomyces sp. NPDC001276 TaxID=3364555 RepID=UPI00368CD840
MTTPDHPIDSYAPPARRRGYIEAMRQIAAGRLPEKPARVYFSAPPRFLDSPNWEHRLGSIRDLLPRGVERLHYCTALDPNADYFAQWPKLAEPLDGLIVTGVHSKAGRRRLLQLGPVARQELITMVRAGKPVLLHSMELGLVPVVDCRAQRTGKEPHQRLRLTIPSGWTNQAPTLRAALEALRRLGSEHHTDEPCHLARRFAHRGSSRTAPGG